MAKKKSLPKFVYVTGEDLDTDAPWYNAQVDLDMVNDGPVGVYQLVETKTKRTTSVLD